ncbi:ATP-dependent dethiobiotin synthetase BioD 1 [Pirellulimonas nuda]|uniref:ATP-dependent dethiobiotin synthetase BioD n=1 Tax=Pirellulimonas nuda TaxID=2528009 RepID=A0A518D631_9BACT|nr:dethiobiotin synthase [Pirellulimonas nuda]QDU86932.1 ATP-dependent dethiobiotin synthetase BioD 1 [Pirellulimonas nuda]
MHRGYFITGTDTDVGKTYVAAQLAAYFLSLGKRVGVYKPVASGCVHDGVGLVSDDAQALWAAAGAPLSLEAVCPQRFEAPLAPYLAAREQGKSVDAALLRSGLDAWRAASDVLIVEGAGGLLSPLSDQDLNADLARDLGLPLIVVAANRLGVINHTLLTLLAARAYGLEVKGVVLCDVNASGDLSAASNPRELENICDAPLLAHVRHGAKVDWRL